LLYLRKIKNQIMLIYSYRLFLCILLLNFSLIAQENALAKINTEGFQNSQVFEIIEELSDSYGPRLTGTHQYYNAAEWAKMKLDSWGLNKVDLEPYCDDCLGWDLHSFNVEVTDPSYMKIEAYPYAWTQDSKGVQEAEIVMIENYKDLEAIKKTWEGKLKGKTVLIGNKSLKLKGDKSGNNILLKPLSKRHSEEKLNES